MQPSALLQITCEASLVLLYLKTHNPYHRLCLHFQTMEGDLPTWVLKQA